MGTGILGKMTIIDQALLDKVSFEAKASLRQRMNYGFHHSLDSKHHRAQNAIEPRTEKPMHRHPTKDESFVVLREKACSMTYDDGAIIESVALSQEEGLFGVEIPKGAWYKHENLDSGSVVFEYKGCSFVPHEEEGIVDIQYSGLID